MDKVARIIAVVLVVISVTAVVCTVFIPSHTGEIRQDLQVGDYYTEYSVSITGETRVQTYRIESFNDDGTLNVSMSESNITVMTKEEFLDNILFTGDYYSYTKIGSAQLDTAFGERLCDIYEKDDVQYWIGEHDIIYKRSFHGIAWQLKETSLIIT